MATRGNSAQIIVGAAQLYVKKAGAVDPAVDGSIPDFVADTDYNTTVAADTTWRSVGYTSNGLEMSFEPDFGEVKVDQLLDVAKMYKQGMKVSLKTSFAEATLENLLLAIAATNDLADQMEGTAPGAAVGSSLELIAGELGEYPVERGLIAIGASVDPGMVKDADGDVIDADATNAQRVYIAYRALSIESVNVSAKRDEATMFEVNFRMLPNDLGAYGKIIDRTFTPTSAS
jgi:hypothetical protein